MTAILVLGMHRSGTSCLAGMIAGAGLASAGEAVRNWDNARGHHEMLDAIRLNEAVLAHAGGHWLSAPAEARWTATHAAARDRLLASRVDGKPALIKDPRALLALPFWRASTVPFRAIGVVRHPLAVARSLEAWREVPLADGVALWIAHNRALAADRDAHGTPIVDFDATPEAFIDAVAAALGGAAGLAAGYARELVHHGAGDAPDVAGLAEAEALYRTLASARVSAGGGGWVWSQPSRFPRADYDAFAHALAAREVGAALDHARRALAAVADASSVLVPAIARLIRAREFAAARALIAESRVERGLADLLDAKVLLALGDAAAAVPLLERACSQANPLYQARHLLPQAFRSAGRFNDARAALRAIADATLYPHGPRSTFAEWSYLDGDRTAALAEMARAIAAAPPHRRGRLRTRRAEWLAAGGDVAAARVELEAALVEDPAYARARAVLSTL